MIYISIGSNLGNRINNLNMAVNLLTQSCLRNSKSSIILETEAILPDNTPPSWNKPFLNMIVAGETDLSPDALLITMKSIESDMGRLAIYEKWAPRIIDLDILLWDELEINTPQLTIPHPELSTRPFLQHLLALMELQPWTKMPLTNSFSKSFVLNPAIVGVVNVTNDSFSDGGQFNNPDKAIEQIQELASDGASIIEIGAQSTRPGAVIHTPEEEYNKLKPVLDGITTLINKGMLKVSIDSFWSSTVKRLLENYQISWINDVKGDFDNRTLKSIAEKGCKLCFMHSLSIPPNQELILSLEHRPISLIKEWGKQSIERLLNIGFSQENIILDPGIGFGKSSYQNIEILRYVQELRSLDVQIMVGHSRKSYIQAFSTVDAKNRDIETIATSLALKDKVDFLRVHNVRNHMRFFTTYQNFHQ
ncbi:dihydropteroate synthase [Candidatus Tisiphia endosymbiont of Ptychoptera albimana]|uniref:dihydropteroate synthase n=1 Tax=Candidatus Tisiphia endosymbiont of Ptychoptera albimana TaxID=3066260 RepID=UPI001D26FE14|nr:dihydropteroate synthase [Rickettsia endosymbiont of Sericostoma sp. HW-2014]